LSIKRTYIYHTPDIYLVIRILTEHTPLILFDYDFKRKRTEVDWYIFVYFQLARL